MEITCPACTNGTASDGNPCVLCSGDGVVDLADNDFAHYGSQWKLHGQVWDAILTSLSAIKAKTDNLPDDTATELDDIKEKVDEIKEVVDEL